MKIRILVLTGFLLMSSGVLEPLTPTSHAAQRTPVSCSYVQFHFGQNALLVTSREGQLSRADGPIWQALPAPSGWDEMSVTPDGTIYLIDHDTRAIYRSIDKGTTWQQSGQAPNAPVWIANLSASPVQGLIFLGACSQQDSEIYRSEDGGTTWEFVLGDCGGPVSFSPDFARDGLAFTITAYKVSARLWKSLDWGQTWGFVWQNLATPFAYRGGVAFSPQFSEDRTAFTDFVEGFPYSLSKTTDGGATWFKVNDRRVDGPPAFSPDYGRDQTFLVGQDQNLALTQDGGRTLTPIWDKANGYARVWGVRRQAAPIVPPTPSAPSQNAYRYYLPLITGGLQNAHRYYLPLMIGSPSPLEFWLVAQEATSSDCYLYRSRDGGASWQEIAVP